MTVTTLSTVAMILYPIIAMQLRFNDLESGIFLGGTIHDVAQVVGAGYGMNSNTGDTATIIKLFRVALLVPVVMLIAFVISKQSDRSKSKLTIPYFFNRILQLCVDQFLWIHPSRNQQTGKHHFKHFLGNRYCRTWSKNFTTRYRAVRDTICFSHYC